MKKAKNTRFFSVLLSLSLLLTSFALPALAVEGMDNFRATEVYYDGVFRDVRQDDWFYSNVKSAYELGLMNGKAERQFGPGDNIDYASSLVLACRLHKIYHTSDGTFNQGNVWWQVYVDYAATSELYIPGGAENFGSLAGTPATRLDFALMLAKALPPEALPLQNEVTEIPGLSREQFHAFIRSPEVWEKVIAMLSDEEIESMAGTVPGSVSMRDILRQNPNLLGDEYIDAVYDVLLSLYGAGILDSSNTSFRPEATIVRSEACAIITRMAVPNLRLGSESKTDFNGNPGAVETDTGDLSTENNAFSMMVSLCKRDGFSLNAYDIYCFYSDDVASGEMDENGYSHVMQYKYSPGQDVIVLEHIMTNEAEDTSYVATLTIPRGLADSYGGVLQISTLSGENPGKGDFSVVSVSFSSDTALHIFNESNLNSDFLDAFNTIYASMLYDELVSLHEKVLESRGFSVGDLGFVRIHAPSPEKSVEVQPTAETAPVETQPVLETSTIETQSATEMGTMETQPATETGTVETKPATETGTVETKPATETGAVETKPVTETETEEMETKSAAQPAALEPPIINTDQVKEG